MTFLPMHWLGLSGMPRRIPDYPDIYWAWNFVCSLGSFISALGLFFFFFLILKMFINKSNIYLLYNTYLGHSGNYGLLAYNIFNKSKMEVFIKFLYFAGLCNHLI